MARAILDEVILVLWPSINPDGQNMVVEWYTQETAAIAAPDPEFWQPPSQEDEPDEEGKEEK